MTPLRPSAVVIGAGLAGLVAADEFARRDMDVTVVAPGGRSGGVLGTVRDAGWLVERSADCFLAARPEGVALATRLGLDHELIGVEPVARRALVWHAGRTLPVPSGFRLIAPGRLWPLLASPLLSPAGRARLFWERFVPPRPAHAGDDESLESFAVRRLGREAFERLVQPLAAGIWTADPARLSMAAACPDFLAMERDHGSLWAGERRRLARSIAPDASGARYGQFVTLAGGMETLPRRLAEDLHRRGVRSLEGTASSVVRSAAGGWQVAGDWGGPLPADAVVVATPAAAASRLLATLDATLAGDLAAIEYAGSCIVSLGFAREQVAHPLDAAGVVIPRSAGRRILAVSFSSSKFPGRAPPGCVLMRVFIGGALDPEATAMPDDALVIRARDEVGEILGARGEPQLTRVERWDRAMPQYHVGHVARVARIEAAVGRHPGLALAGAAYEGVGIPQVIASGQKAAVRCLEPSGPA
ncbi:MAG: protoporphyrinogen oxidase [Planctomycetaceae bacterium]